MDNDTFNAYINQALVDSTSAADSTSGGSEFDKTAASVLGNDLLLQLILSAANSSTAGASTIDPNSLNSATAQTSDSFMAPAPEETTTSAAADPNALFTAALLSALAPLPGSSSLAPSADTIDVQGAEAMLVDPSPPALVDSSAAATSVTTLDKRPAATAAGAGAKSTLAQKAAQAQSHPPARAPAASRQTIQQQALSSAGKRNGVKSTMGNTATNVSASSVSIATTANSRVNTAAATAQVQQASSAQSGGIHREGTPNRHASPEHEGGADDMEGIDMKNLTSKERRQLRNKISARNFRVRRKEYISNLEAEVRMHKEEADSLRKDLTISKKENLQLRDEIQKLRLRLNALSLSQTTSSSNTVSSSPLASTPASAAGGNSALARAVMPTTAPAQQPAKASPAPVVRFNPHKDIGQVVAKKGPAGPSASTGGSWAAKSSGSGFITVNTALLPSSQATRSEELLREARRKQAVDILLSMRDEEEPSACSVVGDEETTRSAAIGIASLVAEIVLSQLILESSIAVGQAGNAATERTAPTMLRVSSC
ncbi:hypothetical protein GQ54DRAFT_312747 [Martensiomyces pterosporus]|nr:hypothetical protein GQ54DRAFT_312747 [Martensiomyces pterosporus]